MKNSNIVEKFSDINKLISFAQNLSKCSSDNESDEIQAHCAKYICVLSSVFICQSVLELCREYCRRMNVPEIKRGIGKNLRYKEIENLICELNKKWKEELSKISHEKKDSINSIVSNRNKIAHGENSDVTLRSIEKWLKDSVEVIKLIEKMLDSELAM